MTEIIRIENPKNLMTDEVLPEIPKLVEQYLSIDKKVTVGKHWQVKINQQSSPTKSDGIAYSCELVIEKKAGDKWKKVYSTGMRQYRGAYNYEIDNWNLSLREPHILKETGKQLIYGLRTGAGIIYVYRFLNRELAVLERFNNEDYIRAKERIELQENVSTDPEAALGFIKKGLEAHWYTASKVDSGDDDCCLFNSNGKKLSWNDRYDSKGNQKDAYDEKKETGIVILLARQWDRDYDPICIGYRIFIWVKGQGIGKSQVFRTKLHHPGGKFYRVGISFDPEIANCSSNSIAMGVRVWNRSQQWEQNHELRFEWREKPVSEFEKAFHEAMEDCVRYHGHNHPLYQQTRIKESIIDPEKKVAIWILFEQIDSDRCTEEGEGWLGDQFRYSLWKLNGNEKPVRIYEDHAYIRPRSISTLTGTRGRDCTLKYLKVEERKISVRHNCGETVEKQKWEVLHFDI